MTPRDLWCAVIERGILDLDAKDERLQELAWIWMTWPNQQFEEVCHLAGIPPEKIREKYATEDKLPDRLQALWKWEGIR